MNCQRRSLTQLGIWALDGVCHPPHPHPSSNKEPDVGAKRNVSPYLTVSCAQVPVGKFQERLPTGCIYLIQLFFPPSCVLMCWCVGSCVRWGLAVSHPQRGTDFAPCDVRGGPFLCAPSTSARVQNRFEFVDLSLDMSSKYTGEVQARTGISGWYQLVPRTHYISTRI